MRQQQPVVAVKVAQAPAESRSLQAMPGTASADILSRVAPFRSDAKCQPALANRSAVTPKQLDLQQQRRAAIEQSDGSPAGGYLAICVLVKGEADACPPGAFLHACTHSCGHEAGKELL